MTISTNTTDRKAMAKAMAEHLGTTAKYMGVPSCGYQVGDYIVDKEGNIHGDDFEPLRDFLQTIGCFPASAFLNQSSAKTVGRPKSLTMLLIIFLMKFRNCTARTLFMK